MILLYIFISTKQFFTVMCKVFIKGFFCILTAYPIKSIHYNFIALCWV